MKKKINIVLFILCILMISGCGKYYEEPCEWCDVTKTKCFEKEDGGKCYICDVHSNKCLYCDKKVQKHYSSPTGMEVFVCNDCYEEDMELMKAVENGEFDDLE